MGCSISKKLDSWVFGSKYLNILIVGDASVGKSSYIEMLICNRLGVGIENPVENARKYGGIGFYTTIYESRELKENMDGIIFMTEDKNVTFHANVPHITIVSKMYNYKGKNVKFVSSKNGNHVQESFKTLFLP